MLNDNVTLTLPRDYAKRIRRQMEESSGSLMMPTLGWERFYNFLVLALEPPVFEPVEEKKQWWERLSLWIFG